MDAVESHCDRAMLIEEGVVDVIGDPESVAERFVEVILPTKHAGMSSDGPAGVSAAWIADSGAARPSPCRRRSSRSRSAPPSTRGRPVDSLELDLDLLSHPEGVRISRLRVGSRTRCRRSPPASRRPSASSSMAARWSPPSTGSTTSLSHVAGSGRLLDRSPEPIRLRITGRRSQRRRRPARRTGSASSATPRACDGERPARDARAAGAAGPRASAGPRPVAGRRAARAASSPCSG